MLQTGWKISVCICIANMFQNTSGDAANYSPRLPPSSWISMAFRAKKQRQVCYIETGDQKSIENADIKFPGEARMDRNNDNFNQREHHWFVHSTRYTCLMLNWTVQKFIRSHTFSSFDLQFSDLLVVVLFR